jgi:hypothetical protein
MRLSVAHMTTTTKTKSRAARITIGAVLATVGTVAGLSGAGVLAYTGSDGAISSGQHELSTPTTALVSEAAKLNHTDDIAAVLGDPEVKLSAKSEDGERIFIGIAREADVDRYLAGAPIDRVTNLEVKPYDLDTERRAGSATPTAPTEQSFWVADSSGEDANVDWQVADGTYRVVVMNADGSPGVATDGELELDVPHLNSIALMALLVGFAGLAGGIALMTPSSMSISPAPVRRSV